MVPARVRPCIVQAGLLRGQAHVYDMSTDTAVPPVTPLFRWPTLAFKQTWLGLWRHHKPIHSVGAIMSRSLGSTGNKHYSIHRSTNGSARSLQHILLIAVATGSATRTDTHPHARMRADVLVLAPEGWLLAFIRMLPAKDRLTLFQVNRQLASRVVQCAAKSTLHIHDDFDWLSREGAEKVQLSVIRQALEAQRHNFKPALAQDQQGQPSFLTSLTNHITSFDIQCVVGVGHASACLDWCALHNLTVLNYNSRQNSEQDMSMLCSALEAGQLKCLKRFTLELRVTQLRDVVLERLARALGPQLQHLATHIPSLVTYLPFFTALQTIHLFRTALTSLQAQCLCEQSLRVVDLDDGIGIQGDHSQRSCKWGSLVVWGWDTWRLLSALPLAGVQQVCLTDGVSGWDVSQRVAMDTVLAQHSHRFKCQPSPAPAHLLNDLPTYTLAYLGMEMIPLVAQMYTACRLRVECEPQHPGLVAMVWRLLPACVQVVKLERMARVDWVHLWQGLPEHVHTVEVWQCEIPVSELCMLVRTVPKHVSVLELRPRGTVQSAAWDAAGVRGCTPEHVKLQILERT